MRIVQTLRSEASYQCSGGYGRTGSHQRGEQGYIRRDPGVGAAEIRISCDAPEYRENEAEMRDHRAAEL